MSCIVALDKQTSREPKLIPEHPFSLSIISPKSAGKSTLLLNLLLFRHFYRGFFDRIIIFSPTFHNDPKWSRILHEPVLNVRVGAATITPPPMKYYAIFTNENSNVPHQPPADTTGKIPLSDIHTTYNDQMLRQIMDEQRNQKGCKKLLIIFEDAIALNLFSRKQNNAYQEITTILRHLNCSIITVSQTYKSVPRGVRTNCSNLCVFEISNAKEVQMIFEENPFGLTREQWLAMYKYITKPDYSFVHFDNQNRKGYQIVERFENFFQGFS